MAEGDGLELGDGLARLELRINDCIPAGCAGFAAGHAGAENLQPLARVTLRRAEGWQRREPQIIGSDGGGGND